MGDDFVEVITRAVGSCDVLLALIGDQWLAITDARGQRRLDNPDDFVRLEIEAALTRNVRVIPILVEGARLPRADELPPALAGLVRRQALELSPARFDFDISRLLKVLDSTLVEIRSPGQRVPKRLLENVQTGVVACNAEGVLTLFNGVTRELHGLSEESIPSDQWAERYRLYQPDGQTAMVRNDVPLYRAGRESGYKMPKWSSPPLICRLGPC